MPHLFFFFFLTQGKKLSWLLSSLLNDSAKQICSKMCEKTFCKQNYLSKINPIALVLYKFCVNPMRQVEFNPGLICINEDNSYLLSEMLTRILPIHELPFFQNATPESATWSGTQHLSPTENLSGKDGQELEGSKHLFKLFKD